MKPASATKEKKMPPNSQPQARGTVRRIPPWSARQCLSLPATSAAVYGIDANIIQVEVEPTRSRAHEVLSFRILTLPTQHAIWL